MLVDFEVENFRSYREMKRFSLVAATSKEFPENYIRVPELNTNLIKTAAIYGPNAAGKSNLLMAMNYLSEMMTFPRYPTSIAAPIPFRLDPASASKPCRFLTKFFADGILYEYSIAIRPERIEDERLVAYPNGRAQEWFHRTGSEISFNRTHLKGQKEMLKGMTPPDAPFLAVAFTFGQMQLAAPANWISSNLRTRLETMEFRSRFGRDRRLHGAPTAQLIHEDESFRSWATGFLRHADLGIQRLDIEVSEEKIRRPIRRREKDGSITSVVQEVTQEHYEPFFVHRGGEGATTRFGLEEESQGTRRLFAMLVPLFEVLRDGGLAVIDEFSASLHPTLVREVIRSFHNPDRNPKHAQLLFATHDTNLLSGTLFRRDQVWFTEKDATGATDLYSLQDIKGVNKDEAFEKGYLRGRYGAIPFFREFDFPPIVEGPADAADEGPEP